MSDFHDMRLYCRKGIFTISLIVLIIVPARHSTILKVTEGESVRLDFPYPCDSTEVTLRHGYERPFYRSANPQYASLSPNQDITKDIDLESKQCFLNFTINPVSRDDQGTFILMAYKDGVMLLDCQKFVRVDYPDGKASCEIGDEYNVGWVSLRCTAPKGTLPGQIICYQNDTTLPQANKPTESGQTLIQNVLAKLNETHLIHCCSSTISNITDKCECEDWGWDPIQSIAQYGTVDPCPRVHSTQGIKSSYPTTTNTANSSLLSNHTAIPTEFPMQKHRYILLVSIFIIFILVVISLSIAHYYGKARQGNSQD